MELFKGEDIGTVVFTPIEYRAFMSGLQAVAYSPSYDVIDGKEVILYDYEVDEHIGSGRYLVTKRVG